MTSPPASPPPALQGSSRTTGGTTRGHAAGNIFNFADADPDADIEMLVPRTGKVHLYNSLVDPLVTKPSRILKINVQTSMASVLKSIAAKWSPIESKPSSILAFLIDSNFVLESNPQISVFEEGEWTDKGRYNAAVSFDEDVEWVKEKRDYILPVCYVGN